MLLMSINYYDYNKIIIQVFFIIKLLLYRVQASITRMGVAKIVIPGSQKLEIYLRAEAVSL